MDLIWPKFRRNSANSGRVDSPFLNSNLETPVWRFETNSSVYSSPTIDAHGIVYFSGSDGNIFAVTSTGSLLWKYSYPLVPALYEMNADSVFGNLPVTSATIDRNG